MKYVSITFIICILLLSRETSAQTDSFVVDGVYRNYIVHLPTGYNASNAYPLVLNLHGYTSNAGQQELYTQMDASADANRYIVVYPNGIGSYWNSWGPPGSTYGADDVKFLSELIDTISAHSHVNPKRVYSCGMSNGGYMSYTLACRIADKLAAIASVSGTMSQNTYSTCNPARKIPVMHIHGTADPTVNYSTGAANSIGVEQTIAFWRDTDVCQNVTDTVNLPDINTSDNCTVQRIHYPNCANGNDILFYKITNGGHTWPDGLIDISQYGNTNHDMSATDEIWKFFDRYTLDGPVPTGICCEIPDHIRMSIYPNPATNVININQSYNAVSADVYDATGRKVVISLKNNTLDISSLERGIYAIKVTNATNEQSIARFIKD